jgi:hypothetical protein
LKQQNRGQIRVVEALLAVLIIFSSLAVSASLTPNQTRTRSQDLASVGLNVLVKMDSDGNLGKFIDEKNWTAIRTALNLLLPSGMNFNVTVLDEQLQQVNSETITNGDFIGREVAYVEYIAISRSPDFCYYIVRMNLVVVS